MLLLLKNLSMKHNNPLCNLSMVYSITPLLMDIWVVSSYLLFITNNTSFVSAFATKYHIVNNHQDLVEYKNNYLLFTSLKAQLWDWHTVTSTHMPSFKASHLVKPNIKGGELLRPWWGHDRVVGTRKAEELERNI